MLLPLPVQIDADGNGNLDYEECLRFVLRDTVRREASKLMQILFHMDARAREASKTVALGRRAGAVTLPVFRKAVSRMGVVLPSSSRLVDELFELSARSRPEPESLSASNVCLICVALPRRPPLSL